MSLLQTSPALTVVIAEDEPMLLDLMVELVAELGFDPRPFTSADDALAFISTGHGKTRLVITDFCMPGQITGGDLALAVSASYPQIPVILTSGYMNASPRLGPGVTFFPKPWSLEKFSQLIAAKAGNPQ